MLGACCSIAGVQAQDTDVPPQQSPPHTEDAGWNFSALGYGNLPRQGDNYVTGIFGADHGQLHLEGRTNYEAVHAQSAFIGWTFSGGETVKLKATPIVGVLVGSAHGGIAGLEASVAIRKFDFYVEVEYVRDWSGRESNYVYAWSEFAYRPWDWLRLGSVVQRTRVYGGDREIQRGGFFQLTFGKFTAGTYWFNPGSQQQIAIVSFGISF
jgi:hypothetical protein